MREVFVLDTVGATCSKLGMHVQEDTLLADRSDSAVSLDVTHIETGDISDDR